MMRAGKEAHLPEGQAPGEAPPAERKARRIALAFILVPVLATLIWGVAARYLREPVQEEEGPIVALGAPAPDFTFPSLAGPPISLSGHRGKVVLVNIWATWCPPCIDELPSLQNLYAKMKEKGAPFEILAVDIDALGAEPVKKFVDRFKLTFPIPLDPRGKIKKLYRTSGVPETFVVDPAGKIVEKVVGPRKWDSPEVIAFIEQILRNAAQAGPAQPAK
ncbi:MAG: TlpA disulfide reductase family protein [Nitrospinota bacterium]